jgi:hypothetical protein
MADNEEYVSHLVLTHCIWLIHLKLYGNSLGNATSHRSSDGGNAIALVIQLSVPVATSDGGQTAEKKILNDTFGIEHKGVGGGWTWMSTFISPQGLRPTSPLGFVEEMQGKCHLPMQE